MKLLVYMEKKEGKIRKASLELLGLADSLKAETDVLLAGVPEEKEKKELSNFGVRKLYFVKIREEEGEEEILNAFSQIEEEYDLILLSADRRGKSLTPCLAERLGAASINDALEVSLKEGSLCAKIPIYAGRFVQRVKVLKKKAVISIRPGSYEKPKKDSFAEKGIKGNAEEIYPIEEKELQGDGKGKARLLKTVVEKLEEINLKEAEIIVSGGRGMGTKENYERLCGELAKVLGAGLGASRSAVNQGWIGREHQVGQTGNIVKPKLYIACGISGAPQHQAGMRDSGYILAINQDENAEIFDIANIALVGDVNEMIPLLIEEIKRKLF
jgi:electron transfer flavoprotein alpha subunit